MNQQQPNKGVIYEACAIKWLFLFVRSHSFGFGYFNFALSVFTKPNCRQSYVPAKFQTQETLKRQLSLAYDTPPVVKLSRISKVDSDDFPNDFAIDVKNVGNKPIYYMRFYLLLPEVEVGGLQWAFIIDYGNPALLDLNEIPNQDDVSIKPGETYTVIIKDKQLKNFSKFMKDLEKSRGEMIKITKVELDLFMFNFGDRTGYILGKPNGKQVGQ